MAPGEGRRRPDLRACLVCSILQPTADFVKHGCPNCEDVCDMRNSADRVAECTSLVWDGMIAVVNPEESWVARWQRIEKKQRGMYAVMVTGRAPPDVVEAIEARGGTYRPRDRVED